MTAIVWFRNDLRLADHPALAAAMRTGERVLCVYIHAPDEEGKWAPGAASDAWRHRSLEALDADLRERGSRLHLYAGDSEATLRELAGATQAKAVFWHRRYEPAIEQRDARIKRVLREDGVRADSLNGSLLFEPWELATQAGDPFRVFTPFWRAALKQWHVPDAMAAPRVIDSPARAPAGVTLASLGLRPRLHWDAGFFERFTPGEAGAHAALQRFTRSAVAHYKTQRDIPADHGTSRLSPHLHFGEIAPWRAVHALAGVPSRENAAVFERELGWREFAHHVLHHFPQSPEQNFNRRFDSFGWKRASARTLSAWQRGRTGVPIVDAGLRELWATGWMHNRVRMIVASFLTKNLRLHWQHGARWFWDTLVDADLANNSMGWQWVAGTGVDAAPYFRVFNPVLQSKKFDADGQYIAHWVPELAALPAAVRHEPWTQPALLAKLAPRYPKAPLVDLAQSRLEALAAYRA